MGMNGQRTDATASLQRMAGRLRRLSRLAIAAILAGSLVFLGSLAACSTQKPPVESGEQQDSGSLPGGQLGVTRIAEGKEAPDFEFMTADNRMAKLSDYRGQVVLLNFWATWCGYCIQEMPAMNQIAQNYEEVVVVAINRGDSASEAIAFAEDSDYDFVWGLDDDGSIAALYPSNGIPYSVIIDRDGTIATIYEGSSADMYPYFEKAVTKAGA